VDNLAFSTNFIASLSGTCVPYYLLTVEGARDSGGTVQDRWHLSTATRLGVPSSAAAGQVV